MTTKLVQRVARNTKGRDIIVGDVHGQFTALGKALDSVGFNHNVDRLFFVGDLVDRGPESIDALEWLGQSWAFAVAGNHEAMLLDHAAGQVDTGIYRANGGGWALALTRPELGDFAAAFRALPIAIELETADGLVGIVHAECPLATWSDFTAMLEDPSVSDMKRSTLIACAQWMRTRIELGDDSMISGVRAVVVGHAPMERMTSLGNTLFIDTAGWHPRSLGRFTLLDAATLQAAQKQQLQPA